MKHQNGVYPEWHILRFVNNSVKSYTLKYILLNIL